MSTEENFNTTESTPSDSTQEQKQDVQPANEPTDEELYQQQLTLSRERREEAARRKAAYTLRQEAKAEREEEPDDLDTRFRQFEERIVGTFAEVQTQSAYEAAIKSRARTPLEEEAIRDALNNRIIKTGDPAVDVADAHALVNKHKLASLTKEVQRTQQSQNTASTGYANNEQGSAAIDEPALTPAEARLAESMRKLGVDPSKVLGK